MSDLLLVSSAATFAAEAHKHCVRKEINEPYIVHPARVAKMAAQLNLPATDIAAAWLHDVLEDTDTPAKTLEDAFPERTFRLVKALTKWWEGGHPSEVVSANKDAYYKQIIATDGAVILKILDRVDNLYDFARIARMTPSNHSWAERYLKKTVNEFLPLQQSLNTRIWSGCEASPVALRWYSNAVRVLEDSL